MDSLNFFKFIEAAFRYKVKNKLAPSFKYLSYDLPYENKDNIRGIFESARRIFPSFYTSLFENTKEGHIKMAEDLVSKLDKTRQDLTRYFKPEALPKDHLQVIVKAQVDSEQMTAEQQAAGTASSSGGMPGLPSGAAFSGASSPRHIILQTPPPNSTAARADQITTSSTSAPISETSSSSVPTSAKSSTSAPTSTPISTTSTSEASSASAKTTSTSSSYYSSSTASPSYSTSSSSTSYSRSNPSPPRQTTSLKTSPSSSQGKFNFSAFKSKVGGEITNAARIGLEKANPFLKKAGTGLVNNLTNIANPGGIGGTGSRSIFGRFNRLGRGSGKGIRSLASNAKQRGGLMFVLGILGFMMLVGTIAISGTSSTGEAAPIVGIGTATDISSCKFTRADESVPIKSSILAGWISGVATKEGIPPAVMASVAMHENPVISKGADDEHDAVKNNYYYIVSQVNQDINKETNAIGLMQISTGKTPTDYGIVDHCQGLISSGVLKRAAEKLGKKIHDEAGDGGMSYYCTPNLDERIQKFCQTSQTEKNKVIFTPNGALDNNYLNLCRIQDNLAISAEMLNGKIGSGSWQSEINVKSATNAYYGRCGYPGGDYCNEVWQDLQNCQATSVATILPAPINGDYKGWVKGNFNVDVSGLSAQYSQWAYEVLNTSTSIAPKFRGLIFAKPTKVVPSLEGSYTSGDTINIRAGYDANFFKQIFVHELGHRIKGAAGTTSPQCPATGQTLEQIAQTEQYLTYYAENATPANVKSPACGTNNQTTRNDEDFAEAVSYYINAIPELNYGSGCSTYNTVNPYSRTTQPRPLHKAYIQCLLGP